eukprot:CAMPEP_0184722904 /NCGR_PEP_ID=MMETSP0314-20130426/23632_1 /TAXON_ID=38298 /ORGANISM="Rhodella maculata, Strain CCMP 736" /LENGTH=346 /DNA_ID=CAMNT_0027187601 /DNA_START=1 /DNA_END=1041 /DNA_ORIENTATION=-
MIRRSKSSQKAFLELLGSGGAAVQSEIRLMFGEENPGVDPASAIRAAVRAALDDGRKDGAMFALRLRRAHRMLGDEEVAEMLGEALLKEGGKVDANEAFHASHMMSGRSQSAQKSFLKVIESGGQSEISRMFGVDWSEAPYLGFPSGYPPVLFVSDERSLSKAESILKSARIVSIDTETQPVFSRGEFEPTSLVQLAVRAADGGSTTIVMDLLTTRHTKIFKRLCGVLKRVILDPDVCIIALSRGDFVTDMAGLRKSYQVRGMDSVQNLVELNSMWRALVPSKFAVGLRHLCAFALGVRLEKTLQMSRWKRRPLTKNQIAYAALDAYAGLRIYEVLQSSARDSGVN